MTLQEYQRRIRMHHTDSAGVVFYANLFVMAHECYESWLEQYISLSDLLGRGIHIPIVHAEADYRGPMRLSEQVSIELSLVQRKNSSFTLQYVFKGANGVEAAEVRTVHAVIDGQTRESIDIPSFLQDALAAL